MVLITEVSSSSSSSSSSEKWKYDAFLSFRGDDIRNSFISHMYKGLCQEGINTFKDDRELEKGQSISQALPKAIGESRVLIIIFSKNYASSTWCLDELVEILQCKKAGRQTVLPIFYDVTPSQVRKQLGNFEEAFAVHEERFRENIEKVQRWRAAMTEVADLSGWDLQDRDESDFIHEIVKDIISKLGRSGTDITKGLVGMESRLEKMRSYMDIGQSNKVKIIGVWGMGGIGKTTITSVVYKQMYSQFDGSSFLEDVRETSKAHNGLASLQSKLLSAILNRDLKVYDVYKGTDEIRKRLYHKKVLIILDDVDELQQLECLIGKRDENWFGVGTRIIITTRNKHLLAQHGVDNEYMVEKLGHMEAVELFHLKAFKNDCPTKEYVELSDQFVMHASGLPLALSVLGSHLYAKSIKEWKSALDRLKKIPNEEIIRKLQISFDGLDEIDKKIFLDIACFFSGMAEDYVRRILDSCGFYPDSGIEELINKSLITVSYKRVHMHDLLRKMGQEIVRRESRKELGRRSRIWLREDFYHVLMKDTGSQEIEGIVLDLSDKKAKLISAKGFSRMNYLRLLILRNASIFHGLEYLSNELRYLEWHDFPFKSLPSAFQPNKLVELHMQHSNLKHLWKAIKPIKSLKIIDLSYSINLAKTPDFTKFPNLEELNFQGCTRLSKVHQSLEVLKSLVSLNLQDCKNLVILPDGMWNLKSLKILNVGGCVKLFKWIGFGTRQIPMAKIREFLFPTWLQRAKRNQTPQALGLTTWPFLKDLNLSCCSISEGVIPNDLRCFPLLEKLNLSGNPLLSIPSSIGQLSKLIALDFSNCTRLESLPALPPNTVELCFENCTSLQTLPDLVQLYTLINLNLFNCTRLESMPDLPSRVIYVDMENCTALETLPNLFEKHCVWKKFHMNFLNCFKLNYCQSKINVAFTWLRSYLLSLYEIRKLLKIEQEEFEEICHQVRSLFLKKLAYILITLFFSSFKIVYARILLQEGIDPSSELPKFKAETELRIKLNENWWMRNYLLLLYEIRKIEQSFQNEEEFQVIRHQTFFHHPCSMSSPYSYPEV
ncbi:hypothetical protein P3X46_006757 [Hevea brasiliensis]|uniref:TIR domain-containing protein n=1 Tax=Hevea brasiliensis TaxID=3981 RepID=A0ABQ9MT86_HEVBR|nr:disease resistance protein RPV1 isoform X2 [Hevea brasiliensis]KAJ9182805.1 hypothetical protein P3X46_006757 [Hevea brasiliensis]